MAQLVAALSLSPKCCCFSLKSGVQSLIREGIQKVSDQCFSVTQFFSLSLFLSFFIFLWKIKFIFVWRFLKTYFFKCHFSPIYFLEYYTYISLPLFQPLSFPNSLSLFLSILYIFRGLVYYRHACGCERMLPNVLPCRRHQAIHKWLGLKCPWLTHDKSPNTDAHEVLCVSFQILYIRCVAGSTESWWCGLSDGSDVYSLWLIC